MPFAALDKISEIPFDGAVEIAQEQFDEIMELLESGRFVHVFVEPEFGYEILPPAAPPVRTPDEILADATAQLNALNRLANAQVTALQGRVDALADAVELEMATPEEVAEQTVRAAQLKTWKQYRVLLGRVSAAAGWPEDPSWPSMPEPYTNETSAVAAPAV